MDKLDWYLTAYGRASISLPLLVQPDDTFKFVLDPTQFTATTALTAATNIVGRSAGFDESARVSGATAQVNGDLLSATAKILQMQAAYQQYQSALLSAQALGDPTQQAAARANALTALGQAMASTGGTAPALPSTAPPANTAASLLSSATFAAPQTLFVQGTPGVTTDTRTALRTAAGDIATYAMLSFLADPSKMTQFKEKHVVFGVSQVSVNPGWKTKRGASAEVSAHVRYYTTLARPEVRAAFLSLKGASPLEQSALEQLQACVITSIPKAPPTSFDSKTFAETLPPPYDGAHFRPYVCTHDQDRHESPVVAAISPMEEGQSLDLQSATRTQTERSLRMALALSYAGLGAQAAPFADLAQRLQNDVETRTSNSVVNSFNISDGGFGFRVYPQIAADPVNGGTSLGLGASSFPTLIVIATDDQAVRPRVRVYDEGGETRCFVTERQLDISQMTRWVPATEPCIRHAPSSNPCVGEILTEQERLRVTEEADSLVQNVPGEIGRHMSLRFNFLDAAFNSKGRQLYLPLQAFTATTTANPTANTIAPAELDVDRTATGIVIKPITLLVAGADLDQLDLTRTAAVVGDIDWIKSADATPTSTQPTPNATLVGKTLQLVFQVKTEKPVVFQLFAKSGGTSIFTKPLLVRARGNVIERTVQTDKQTGESTDLLQFSTTISDEVMKAEIEKSKKHYPNQKADVKVRVDAEARDRKATAK